MWPLQSKSEVITGRARHIVVMDRRTVVIATGRLASAYQPGDSGKNDEKSIHHTVPLRREMRSDRLRRTKPDECLTLRSVDRQPALLALFYGIDEMFTRLLDDPSVLESMLPELARKPAQICFEQR
jgi:hypothetical protein